MACLIQLKNISRPNTCFCFPSGSRLNVESSQQVAVAERLRKRELSQLAPGMAFFIVQQPLVDVPQRRIKAPSFVRRIDRRVIFPNLGYAIYWVQNVGGR